MKSNSPTLLVISDEYPSSPYESVKGGAGVHLQMIVQLLMQEYPIVVIAKNTASTATYVEKIQDMAEIHWVAEKYYQKSRVASLIGLIIQSLCTILHAPRTQEVLLWNISNYSYLLSHPKIHFDILVVLEFRANALLLQLLQKVRSIVIVVGWTTLHLRGNRVPRLGVDARFVSFMEKVSTSFATSVTPTSHLLQETLYSWAKKSGVAVPPFSTIKHHLQKRSLPRRFTSKRPCSIHFVGRLEPRKGADILLKIATEKKLPPAIFRFWGNDDSGRFDQSSRFMTFHQLVEQHRDSFFHTVEVAPALTVNKVEGALREADIVVLPSRFDPLNLVALQALSLGKCVIVTHVMGVAELIESGKTGYVIRPTTKHLLQTLTLLMANPQRINGIEQELHTNNPLVDSEHRVLKHFKVLINNVHLA